MASITALAQKNRPAGEYTSPAWLVPGNLAGTVVITFVMPLSELQNTANRLDCHYEVSGDGITWADGGGFGWDGGNYTNRQGEIVKGPGIGIKAAEVAGKYVRFKINLNRPIVIGVDIDQ